MWLYRHNVLEDCQGAVRRKCKGNCIFMFLVHCKTQTPISLLLEDGSETIEG